MDLKLNGDAVLVTASSSGLGKASATALAREGANVVINRRDEDRLAEARDEISDVGPRDVIAQQGDLTVKRISKPWLRLQSRSSGASTTL